MQDALLWAIVGLVLVLPFASHAIEQHLEPFLLVMGCLAVTVSSGWSVALLGEALREPLPITGAVLVAGWAFHAGRARLERALAGALERIPLPAFLFLAVTLLGVLSSVITAIIAALILVEIVGALRMDRTQEVRFTILACFAIGLGAALTPVGEPLSTIVTARLHVDFWYLARLLSGYLLPGILVLGLIASTLGSATGEGTLAGPEREESVGVVWRRSFNVYMFVAALLLLGTGLAPLVDRHIAPLPAESLFWVNMISAILDNATLAAAEIARSMSPRQITAVLLGLLISGGMLIPGNIPNIVAAGHLKIGSREWARYGFPLGLALMAVGFGAWLAMGK